MDGKRAWAGVALTVAKRKEGYLDASEGRLWADAREDRSLLAPVRVQEPSKACGPWNDKSPSSARLLLSHRRSSDSPSPCHVSFSPSSAPSCPSRISQSARVCALPVHMPPSRSRCRIRRTPLSPTLSPDIPSPIARRVPRASLLPARARASRPHRPDRNEPPRPIFHSRHPRSPASSRALSQIFIAAPLGRIRIRTDVENVASHQSALHASRSSQKLTWSPSSPRRTAICWPLLFTSTSFFLPLARRHAGHPRSFDPAKLSFFRAMFPTLSEAHTTPRYPPRPRAHLHASCRLLCRLFCDHRTPTALS